MAGIINYYHGESGGVVDCCWGLIGDHLCYHLQVEGDPHRSLVRDYGGDVGIDPEIGPGDDVVYLRLEDTTGIWVRSYR